MVRWVKVRGGQVNGGEVSDGGCVELRKDKVSGVSGDVMWMMR